MHQGQDIYDGLISATNCFLFKCLKATSGVVLMKGPGIEDHTVTGELPALGCPLEAKSGLHSL